MQNNKVKKDISIFPQYRGDNEYLLNLSLILKSNFTNVDFVGVSLKKLLTRVLKGKKSDVLILNWIEDYPCLRKGFLAEGVETFRFILGMVLFNLSYRKIIWIRHNYKPHLSYSKFWYNIFCRVIHFLSNKVVTHRRITQFESNVIFHPLYAKSETKTVSSFSYLIFGNIKPYKNIPVILQNWEPSRELKIIGKCKSAELDGEIKSLINGKLFNVSYENRFMAVEELNSLLSSVTFVILGHEEDSMIVSGTFYHAISYGANVIVKDSLYGRSIKSEFPLLHIVENFGDKELSNLVPFSRDEIIDLANKTYANTVIAEQWSRLLAD